MFTHILFDLDGTLTDPAEGIFRSLRHTLLQFGLQEVDEKRLKSFIGPPLYESFRTMYGFNEQQVQEAVGYYRAHHAQDITYGNKVIPGIMDLLLRLHNEGKNLYVATTKMSDFAHRVLTSFQLECFFTQVVGSNPDGTRTAKREIIGEILKSIPQDERNGVVMIGDTKYDLIGAKANGVKSIAVTYGYGSEAELRHENPEYLVHTVAELDRFL